MTYQSTTSDKRKSFLAFAVVMIALFFIYDYHHIISKRPQSVHQWRQCDGASIALTYANNGLNLFRPAIHNQHSVEGRSVAEFPIIYYVDGLLIKLLGHQDLVIRLVNLLLFYLGLFCLFRLGALLTKNYWLALLPVVLLHSFPVVAFYSTTSLPDIPAIAFCIAGIYLFTLNLLEGRERNLWLSIMFFSLAGMLKPTSLIAYFAFGGTLTLVWMTNRNSGRVGFKHLVVLFIPVLLTAAYVFWARYYNSINESFTFLQSIKPLWEMDADFIYQTSLRIKQDWIYDYTYKPTMWMVAAMGSLFLLLPFKKSWPVKFGLILLTGGSVAYFYLFFEQFYHHDYYVIELYPLMVAAFLAALYTLSHTNYGDVIRIPVILVMLVILGLNISYTRAEMISRYTEDVKFNNYNDDYFDLEPKLRQAGITRTEKVIASADNSPNISLYLMDQEGYTRFPFGMEQEQIDMYLNQGATYVIHDTDQPKQLENFAPYLKELLIEHKTLQVWSLQMH